MIFRVAPRRSRDLRSQWERWFAWHPVRVTRDLVVWMEVVDRMWTPLEGRFIYRLTSAQIARGHDPF